MSNFIFFFNLKYSIKGQGHCCPTNIQALLGGGTYKKDYLTDYLQEISEKLNFKKWYFGHYHDNKQVNDKYVLLYEDIKPLKFKSVFE